MDYDKQIYSLSAETSALQGLLGFFLRRLARSDAQLARIIEESFEDAAAHAENVAVRFGVGASPEQTIKAGRIVEQLRELVFDIPSG